MTIATLFRPIVLEIPIYHGDSAFCYPFLMDSAHRKTLEAIYSAPTPATLKWRKIEALLVALGARVIEGQGSRVRLELNNVVATFHRPHPHKEAKPYQVRDARTFLEQAGIKP
ncbi:MAG TPA: type II toxin-antitoxin system HicA family toxin [Methylococcaceae bacterium]|nr:type II toxin-antitoxin system HicA family toxin [Methylococcaceae bacterium]